MKNPLNLLLIFLTVAAAVIAISCADLGKYVWVDQYKEPPGTAEKPYTITPGGNGRPVCKWNWRA